MSEAARQRAAQRRALRQHRSRGEAAARDSGAADVTSESPAAHENVTDVHDSDDSGAGDVSDEPAEATVSGDRVTLELTIRRRDWRFLESLAAATDTTPERAVERLIRQSHVKMRASTGASMRYEEFQESGGE